MTRRACTPCMRHRMELAVKRMFLGMLNSGVQAVCGGKEDRRGARQREPHDCG